MTLKTPEEIEIMAEGGRRLGEVLQILQSETRIGVALIDLDKRARELIEAANMKPAFLGYKPHGAGKAYPATLCASVNDVVVHAVPTKYRIKDGDVIKLDLGLINKGLYLDSAMTVGVGGITPVARKLIEVTHRALELAIEKARPGNTLGDIGAAVEAHVTKNKFSVVKGLTGHGIGKELHEDPHVLNTGTPGKGEKLKAGMVIAIEPMVAVGKGDIKQLKDDGYAMIDGSLSAHFEHTVAITKTGPKVLTRYN